MLLLLLLHVRGVLIRDLGRRWALIDTSWLHHLSLIDCLRWDELRVDLLLGRMLHELVVLGHELLLVQLLGLWNLTYILSR